MRIPSIAVLVAAFFFSSVVVAQQQVLSITPVPGAFVSSAMRSYYDDDRELDRDEFTEPVCLNIGTYLLGVRRLEPDQLSSVFVTAQGEGGATVARAAPSNREWGWDVLQIQRYDFRAIPGRPYQGCYDVRVRNAEVRFWALDVDLSLWVELATGDGNR